MAETELERLVIRLVGDGSLYQKMLTTAQASTAQAAQFIESATKKIEGFSTGVKGFAKTAISVFAGFGLVSSLGSAFDKFSGMEKNVARLNIAIEANGKNAKDTTEEYQKFAKSITDTTLATKGQVFALIQQGEVRGLSTENTKKATRDSIALAAALGGEASEYMSAAIGLQTHQFHALRHIRALRGIKDESKVVAQYQKLVELGMNQATAETETSTGKIEKLKRALGGLGMEIGGMVATAIKPFVELLEKAVKWFNELDPAVKKTVTVVALLLLSVSAIGPALAALAPTFAVIGTLVGLVFSPWILLIAPVAAGIAVMVGKLGGLSKTYEYLKQKAIDAWEWTKQKAQEFWDWFQPVWQAMKSFAVAVWEALVAAVTWAWDTVKELASSAWDYIKEVFGGITEDSDLTWENVRDAVRDAFIFAEWAVRNFGPILKWLWVGAEYQAVKFFNQMEYFFKDVIPALARYFYDNWDLFIILPLIALPAIALAAINALWEMFKSVDWAGIWEGFKQSFKDAFMWVVNKATSLFTSLWDYIKHPQKVALLFADATLAAADAGAKAAKDAKERFDKDVKILTGEGKIPPLVIPERVAGELEKSLKDEFDRMGAGLGQSWQEFREKKLAEFAEKGIPPDVLDKVNKSGSDLGRSYANGANKEIKKLDAVVFASAESFAKITAYQDRLRGEKDLKANTATDAKSAAGLQKQDKANQLLENIRDNLKDSPKVNIAPGGNLA